MNELRCKECNSTWDDICIAPLDGSHNFCESCKYFAWKTRISIANENSKK